MVVLVVGNMNYFLKNLNEYGIKSNNKFYIIAEIGINHGGILEKAKELFESASRAGVDAVKFQTYITEKRAPKDSPIFNILKECELSFEAFKELKEYAELQEVVFLSTAFDEESLEYLESIGCDLYKIASFDVTNLQFLKKFAKIQKTLIMSVGMADLDEIKKAYEILNNKNNKIVLLHCISAYPTQEEDANIAAIYSLKQNFDCLIGQSDHTNDIFVPFCAAAAGAQILEKHYQISKDMDCVDAPVSITEEQMRDLVNKIQRLEKIFGNGIPQLTSIQQGAAPYR